jgi:hypothetical protein
LPRRARHGDTRAARRKQLRGAELNSISYLPQAFTTSFFLAASLLLGLMR